MTLQTTEFFRTHLAPLYRQLLTHPITKNYLSGTAIRYDGKVLVDADRFTFPFCTLSTLELAHLFSIFNSSRVHVQAQHSHNADEAPPGLYVTVINTKAIQVPHKNRSGIFVEETETVGLFIDGLHIDHFFLNKYLTPPMLGTIAFTLCAMTAHRAGLKTISLIAAGGKGFNRRHVGFKVWPKLGFDANLLPDEVKAIAHLQSCRTVQDVLQRDPAWWETNGSQRLMTFDLNAVPGTSWQKLLPYVRAKANFGANHG
ncbi:hypothetical protein [Massilia genomosp. 1]|uniref:N-acetyltransferase domain-containing protein n=1 Tax=Massilia genomosp. 1 TaxID=2609280 RepID=A0ABX0N5A1_9BURK|nr:hypothetical protein [Massilia genomosp. 1]NHZ65274.1 hypothetical protein [Massilia genomosp. 1]